MTAGAAKVVSDYLWKNHGYGENYDCRYYPPPSVSVRIHSVRYEVCTILAHTINVPKRISADKLASSRIVISCSEVQVLR